VFIKKARWLILVMSLVTATLAYAAPTIDNSDSKHTLQTVTRVCDVDNPAINVISPFRDTGNSALADIAAELLKPPADFTNHSVFPPGTKPLPAVPAALFMGLTGFMCVTLVRDRKVWLTIVATIFGVLVSLLVPRFSTSIVHPVSSIKKCLLHHLEEVPAAKYNKILDSGISTLVSKKSGFLGKYRVSSIEHPSSQFAINIVCPCLNESFNCSSFKVRQFTCFSPAFIFQSIPRGPPINL
jgi:hypothetical protein